MGILLRLGGFPVPARALLVACAALAFVFILDAALAPLGYGRVWSDLRPGESGQAVGDGPPESGDELAIKQVSQPIAPIPGFHVAFSAPSQASVVAFHAAALAAGGTDNGPPGLRPHDGPRYFAAFVVDPEGHRLDAVHQGAEQRRQNLNTEAEARPCNTPSPANAS